jgi:glycosyltransferase involved in cell wall biosynthesis
MRVVLDGRPVRFPLAGVGQYTANLALALGELASRDVRARLLLFDNLFRPNPEARRLAPRLGGVRVSRRRLLPRRVFTAWLRYAASTMPDRVAGGPFDVWHSTYFEAWPNISRDQRLVSTIHDVIFLTHPQLFAARNLAACRFALARQVRTREQLLLHTDISPDRVTTILLAPSVSPIHDSEAVASLKRLLIDRPYVLYIGSLEPRKDVPTLLRAWCQARARHDFALVLAGAPAYLSTTTLTAISSLPTSVDVRWLGYVSEADKAALLQKATAFAYPSIYEGFGLPVLEALSFGVPVVACNTSSLPQVAGPGALLVEPSSPAQLASAIDTLLGDVALQRGLISRGLEHAATFSWGRVARETVDVYVGASRA